MRKKRRSTYNVYARRNWMYRNKWLLIGAAVIAVLAIALAIVLVTVKLNEKKESSGITYEAMTVATLPTVEFGYSGRDVNLIRGYTQELDYHYVRRNIYVLEDTYDIPLKINLYGERVSSASYRIIDADSDNLLQNGTVGDLVSADDVMNGTIRVDNIIEDDKEYVLDICLTDEKENNIHYYTRVKRASEMTTLSRQIDMALKFNDCLYNVNDEEARTYITNILETNYWKNDNTDFSDMTLFSSIAGISWGKMKVEKLAEPEIEILDADGEIGYFMLKYMVSRKESETDEFYNVSEYYRIRLTDDYAYILQYERKTDQIFDPQAPNAIGTRSAKLGIVYDKNFEMRCNNSGELSCFVANNTLWAMETSSKTMKKIFTFSKGINDTRGNYDQHKIKIVNVSDEGNIRFIVYGYMNSGLHEGRVGIGMYTYLADKQKVEETIFIPTNLTYEILKNSVGNLFYLNSSETLYIMMDQYLYRLNLESDAAELVADGLVEGTYVIHSDGRYIAWQKDSKVNDASAITVLDMETSETYEIHAEADKCIKTLGFLNNELVYGQGEKGDVYEKLTGESYLLMTDMFVINDKYQVQTHTTAAPAYFISAENQYNRVVLNKVMKGEEDYTDAGDYTLFATDLEALPSLETYTEYEETKRTVYYVVFADSTTAAGELTVNEKAVIMFTDEKTVDVADMIDDSGKYYVYAKGEVEGIEAEPAVAINLAYEKCGVVLDTDGTLFYKRGILPSSVELTSAGLERAYEKAKNEENLLNLTGITLTQAMYFTGSKMPIVWEWDGERYIFFGYDNDFDVTMYNIATKEKTVLTNEYLQEIFKDAGRVYLIK